MKIRRFIFPILAFLLIAFPIIFPAITTHRSYAEEGDYILNVDITHPNAGQYFAYCQEFMVTANLTAPGEILNDVTARIEIIGNAELLYEEETQSIGVLG